MLTRSLTGLLAASTWLLSCVSLSNAQTPTTRPAPASAETFASALHTAQPGDTVLTSFATLDMPALPLAIVPDESAPTLVFSDRPEYFRSGDGISCQETIQPGRVRFYTYHVPVPAQGKARRVLSVFENVGDREATLHFAARSEPAIGGDYNAIATEAMHALFAGEGAGKDVRIAPGARYVNDRNEPTTKDDLLVHGLYEFTTDQPLRLTVGQVTATEDLNADAATLLTLPKLPLTYQGRADSAGRGTFPRADRDVTLSESRVYDTASGPAQLVFADGKTDGWIEGVDAITGQKTLDKGNYGVVYRLRVKWKSTDGRGLAVLLTSARFESQWCGFVAAAVRVNAGHTPGGVLKLPREGARFRGIPEACVIQTFDAPADGQETTLELDYTPPGACCLPTPILLVPVEP